MALAVLESPSADPPLRRTHRQADAAIGSVRLLNPLIDGYVQVHDRTLEPGRLKIAAVPRQSKIASRRSSKGASAPKSSLIKLDVAALRLGCHVETLRLRIRSGRLEAYRGPHGAYYIGVKSLRRLRARKRKVLPAPTDHDVDVAWRKSRRRVGEELDDNDIESSRRRELLEAYYSAMHPSGQLPRDYQMVVTFLNALKQNSGLQPGVYRLLVGQGLGASGFTANQAASVLGVSRRQARRLVRKREIGGAVFRAARRFAQVEARRIVIGLRTQLGVEGFRFHRLTRAALTPLHRERPRPAFFAQRLTRDEIALLKHAGLSDEQIWAITAAGIGSDELNQLLLRGTR